MQVAQVGENKNLYCGTIYGKTKQRPLIINLLDCSNQNGTLIRKVLTVSKAPAEERTIKSSEQPRKCGNTKDSSPETKLKVVKGSDLKDREFKSAVMKKLSDTQENSERQLHALRNTSNEQKEYFYSVAQKWIKELKVKLEKSKTHRRKHRH